MRFSWLLFVLLPLPAYAGAWLQDKDDLLVSTQALYYRTDSYFDTGGDELTQQRFSKQEINLYTEYGWREHVTVGANLFVNRVKQGNDNIGIADPEFFARVTLFQSDKMVASIQPLIKLPSFYEKGGSPRGGTDSFDAELSILYGYNLPLISNRDYVDMRIGYRERSEGLNGQYRLDAAYGMHLYENLLCVAAMRSIIATKSNADPFTNEGTLDYDLHKAEISLYYSLSEAQQLSAGYFTHLAGAQTGAGQGFSIGWIQRF